MRRRSAIIIASALLMTLLPAIPAKACSCFAVGIRRQLKDHDGAFIGTVIDRAVGGNRENRYIVYTFRVDELYKGDISEEIQVSTPDGEEKCGVDLEVGDELGVFATRGDERWGMSLCSVTHPHPMWAELDELPPPDGDGAPRFVVGGDYGPARTLVLDSMGRTLAYGWGERFTQDVALCPGGTRAVEIAGANRRHAVFSIRDLATYELIRTVKLPFDINYGTKLPEVEEVECRASDGETAYVQASDTRGDRPRSVLMKIQNGERRVLFQGDVREAAIGTNYMYILTGSFGKKLGRVSLVDGEYEELAKTRRNTTGLSVAPDESFLSFFYTGDCATDDPQNAVIHVVDLSVSPLEIAQLPISSTCAIFADTRWVDGDSFVSMANETLVFDSELNQLGSLEFGELYAWNVDIAGGFLYGVNDKQLIRAELPDGQAEEVQRLPGWSSWSIGVLD